VQAAPGTPLNAQDPSAVASATGEPARPRRVGLLLGVAALVLAADVISKAIVVARMPDHAPIRLLGGLLTITLTRNGGAAFSIGTSMTIVFTAIAVGVIIYILRTARNLRSIGWAITLGLLLGGATGNLLDRIFRAPGAFQGHVVDWIQLPDWPVFNLADSSIVCAGVLVVLLALRGIRLDGTRPLAEASSSQPAISAPDLSAPDLSAPDLSAPDLSAPDLSAPDLSAPDLSAPDLSAPDRPSEPDPPDPDHSSEPDRPSEPDHASELDHSSDPDYPKPEYPEPQSAVSSQPDSSDRMADEGR
jgi:signal peptidase II